MDRTRAHARSRLDRRLEALRPLAEMPRPHKGWIRAIRDALGMSRRELAARMGVSPSTVPDLERSELHDTIKLNTLRRTAEALDCDLIYLLVPRTSLDEMVKAQARGKATRHIGLVAHHSRLEDQAVSEDETEAQLDELAARLIDRQGLWAEPDSPQ